MSDVKNELDRAIVELKKRGIDPSSHLRKDTKGLGDVVEEVLTSVGITQERFKQWFGLKECNCTERKKWLNGLFSWKVKNGK
tara:strand:+ start:1202 stop:1447 length:246 start_codon:yes stop_codon:yes gene_type:complete